MTSTPYDLTERTRRVLLGTYNELSRAAKDGTVDFVGSLDFLDALQDAASGADADTDFEWFTAPNGNVEWDVYDENYDFESVDDSDEPPKEQPYDERIRLLTKNGRLARLLKKIDTLESHSLLRALRDCATATDKTEWTWEVTPSGTVIRPNFEAAEKSSKSSIEQHWGRSIDVTLKILYLPELEEQIIGGAPRSDDHEAENIRQAIVAHLDGALSRPALERAGLLAVETAAHNSEPCAVPEELRQLILDQGKPEPSK